MNKSRFTFLFFFIAFSATMFAQTTHTVLDMPQNPKDEQKVVPIGRGNTMFYLGAGYNLLSKTTKSNAFLNDAVGVNLSVYQPFVARKLFTFGLQAGFDYGFSTKDNLPALPNAFHVVGETSSTVAFQTSASGIKQSAFKFDLGPQLNIHAGNHFSVGAAFTVGAMVFTQPEFSAVQTTLLSGVTSNYTLLRKWNVTSGGVVLTPKLRLHYLINDWVGLWAEVNYTFLPSIKTYISKFTPQDTPDSFGFYNIFQLDHGTTTTEQSVTKYSALGVNGGLVFSFGKKKEKSPCDNVDFQVTDKVTNNREKTMREETSGDDIMSPRDAASGTKKQDPPVGSEGDLVLGSPSLLKPSGSITPSFTWVNTDTKHKDQRLQLIELRTDQYADPLAAFKTNKPIIDKQGITASSYPCPPYDCFDTILVSAYPNKTPPLEKGKVYAWRVITDKTSTAFRVFYAGDNEIKLMKPCSECGACRVQCLSTGLNSCHCGLLEKQRTIIEPNRPSPTDPTPENDPDTKPFKNENLVLHLAPYFAGQTSVDFSKSKLRGSIAKDGTLVYPKDLRPGLYVVAVSDTTPTTKSMGVADTYTIENGLCWPWNRKKKKQCFHFEILPSDHNVLQIIEVEDPQLRCLNYLIAHNYTGNLDNVDAKYAIFADKTPLKLKQGKEARERAEFTSQLVNNSGIVSDRRLTQISNELGIPITTAGRENETTVNATNTPADPKDSTAGLWAVICESFSGDSWHCYAYHGSCSDFDDMVTNAGVYYNDVSLKCKNLLTKQKPGSNIRLIREPDGQASLIIDGEKTSIVSDDFQNYITSNSPKGNSPMNPNPEEMQIPKTPNSTDTKVEKITVKGTGQTTANGLPIVEGKTVSGNIKMKQGISNAGVSIKIEQKESGDKATALTDTKGNFLMILGADTEHIVSVNDVEYGKIKIVNSGIDSKKIVENPVGKTDITVMKEQSAVVSSKTAEDGTFSIKLNEGTYKLNLSYSQIAQIIKSNEKQSAPKLEASEIEMRIIVQSDNSSIFDRWGNLLTEANLIVTKETNGLSFVVSKPETIVKGQVVYTDDENAGSKLYMNKKICEATRGNKWQQNSHGDWSCFKPCCK